MTLSEARAWWVTAWVTVVGVLALVAAIKG